MYTRLHLSSAVQEGVNLRARSFFAQLNAPLAKPNGGLNIQNHKPILVFIIQEKFGIIKIER